MSKSGYYEARKANAPLYLSIHSPNSPDGNRYEKPIFIPVRDEDGTLVWDLRG